MLTAYDIRNSKEFRLGREILVKRYDYLCHRNRWHTAHITAIYPWVLGVRLDKTGRDITVNKMDFYGEELKAKFIID